MNKNTANILKDIRGSIIVWSAAMMFVLVGMTAVAIDIGHLYVVRSELQNAADAAALSGANYLFPVSSGAPNWTLAQTKATSAALLNKVDDISITNSSVQYGYWNISGTPSTLQATTITPGQYDLPAVKVTISKTAGHNGGPVQLYFGNLLGISTVDVSATAVAVVGGASSLNSGNLFPMAIAKSTYDSYWNSSTSQPKIDPLTGAAYKFNVGGNGSTAGTWTTFNTSANDVGTILNFILNGSPISYHIGDNIWIAPGAKTTIYSSVTVGKTVVVPIVSNVTTTGQQAIIAFGVAKIDASLGGSSKFVQMHFIASQIAYDVDPGGPNYGVYTTSRLVH